MTKTFEQLQREYDSQIPDDDIPDENDFDFDEDYDDDYDDWDAWSDYEEEEDEE